jgi:hypothetical protein
MSQGSDAVSHSELSQVQINEASLFALTVLPYNREKTAEAILKDTSLGST